MTLDNSVIVRFNNLQLRLKELQSYLEIEEKKHQLEEVVLSLAQSDVWQDLDKAQQLNQEKTLLEKIISPVNFAIDLVASIESSLEIYELDQQDPQVIQLINSEVTELENNIAQLEFNKMFNREMDDAACYLDLQSGSGGTEAQDWTEMLLRMYSRWISSKGFEFEVLDTSAGEVAGLKSATLKINAPYAFGWLRSETGIHRLVRKSPFDAANRRHTSFAAVFVYPEVNDQIDIKIDPADLRIDVFRASGAGGQHVNKTESAVRITHLPTNIVVTSQSSRSQHQNREQCMQQLKAKLYERELQKKNSLLQAIEDNKSDIGWGSQIRSYILDDSRVKDLRTNVETRNPQAVLDGDLDQFIVESLKQGL